MYNVNANKNKFAGAYELFVWLVYVCLYKYSFYVGGIRFENAEHSDFPYPELILYAILITLYVIPFYKWIAPRLLKAKKNLLLFVIAIVYFLAFSIFYENAITRLFIASPLNSIDAIHVKGLYGNRISIHLTDLLAFFSIAFIRFAVEREARRFQIEKDNNDLKLEVLKAQINPHFLFNTLNFMYAKALPYSQELSDCIHSLSGIMRYALEIQTDKEGKVFLTEEMAHINNVIKINRYRLGNNIKIGIETAGDISNVKIIPFVLITLVENIFEHGNLLNSRQEATVKLCYSQNRTLTFETSNSKSSVQKDSSHQMGLKNITERLRLVYGNNAELRITDSNDSFATKLTIANIDK
jgi:sensor histidine kinase YesM